MMAKIEVMSVELGAGGDEELVAHDGHSVVSWAQVQKLKERADEQIERGWEEYLAGVQRARAESPSGTVPVQHELPRDVVLARIAALTARFSLPLVTGHRKYGAMSDGDLRSLLADIEELIAGEA
jgi:hypothetical protein